jgi:hypothetical protein
MLPKAAKFILICDDEVETFPFDPTKHVGWQRCHLDMRRINPGPHTAHGGTTFTSEPIGELGFELSPPDPNKQFINIPLAAFNDQPNT